MLLRDLPMLTDTTRSEQLTLAKKHNLELTLAKKHGRNLEVGRRSAQQQGRNLEQLGRRTAERQKGILYPTLLYPTLLC
jgi:hypothetical protein